VRQTAQCLAETTGRSIEEIETVTTRNFFRLFSKVPRHLIPAGLDV
jgi:Tat protein secretion system quality control protein TatD with DNase activity